MEDEKRNLQYYLQDDLGSPLRVLYRNGYGEAYGYDEFGTELYESDSIKEEKQERRNRRPLYTAESWSSCK